MPITAALIGGGIGLYTGQKQADAQARANQANLLQQAALTEYSPWTGIKPQAMQVQPVDPTAGLTKGLEGGLAGYMQGQELEAAKMKMAREKELADLAKVQSVP